MTLTWSSVLKKKKKKNLNTDDGASVPRTGSGINFCGRDIVLIYLFEYF